MEDFKFITPTDDAEAACAVIINSLGQVLAIKRADSGKLGLPGGKVDAGERLKDCVVREVQEETGLRIIGFTPCFARKVPGDTAFFVTAFFVTEFILPASGLVPSSEGQPMWVEFWQLCDPSQSAFPDYNSALLRSFLTHFAAGARDE